MEEETRPGERVRILDSKLYGVGTPESHSLGLHYIRLCSCGDRSDLDARSHEASSGWTTFYSEILKVGMSHATVPALDLHSEMESLR
jgi:hypothetical protein